MRRWKQSRQTQTRGSLLLCRRHQEKHADTGTNTGTGTNTARVSRMQWSLQGEVEGASLACCLVVDQPNVLQLCASCRENTPQLPRAFKNKTSQKRDAQSTSKAKQSTSKGQAAGFKAKPAQNNKREQGGQHKTSTPHLGWRCTGDS